MTTASPLRIGIIAPPWVAVPPAAYGGTELVLDVLSRGLTRLGHHVSLFTVGESTCPVERSHLFDSVDPDRMGASVLELRHVAAAYDALAGMDIVHDHTLAGLFLSQMQPVPVITTCHGQFDADLIDLYQRTGRRVPVIAISADQAASARPAVPIEAVIHHGLDVDRYRFASRAPDDLVFMGRMSADKGVEAAILAARAAGRPLRIAAKMREPGEVRYFHNTIEPLLSSEIEYVGEVGFDDKVELLATSAALVNPISWPEPFGMVMIEALACGTPVVAYRRGAAAEIIDHGRTGVVVETFEELVAGLAGVQRFDRAACRWQVEKHFSMERMAADHEDTYRAFLLRRQHGEEIAVATATMAPSPG